MLKPKKRWQIQYADTEVVKSIAMTCGINEKVAQLLAIRGIDEKHAMQFLQPDLAGLYDPYLLDGMKKAVDRIHSAILKNEKILIYGDYDADGVTSTSLLYKTLKTLKANFAYYIPNRFTEGYGLNKEALSQAEKQGFAVVITVDTGISAIEEAAFAKEKGIALIITDHHEPPPVLPDAYAVINPKKPNDTYPFKYLSGVGVAFKLAHALLGRVPTELIDIAAIGTIADLVPLYDENRIIASLGLKQMRETMHIGLKAMLEETGLAGKEITAGHVGFVIAPRINASGRLDTAGHAVRLFISEKAEEATELAQLLNEINQERQGIVEQITEDAFQLIKQSQLDQYQVIVVANEGWNVGVIGIVASRILEKYYRPTIVLSIDPETKMAKGSARSIEGYNIYQALTTVKDILPHFGGHPAAAGLSIHEKDIAQLRTRLHQLANEWLTEEDFIPIEKVDVICKIEDIDLQLVQQLERLAPYGIGNPTPKIVIDQSEVTEITVVGKEKQHLKLKVKSDGKTIDALAFRMGDLKKEIAHFSKIQLLGELSINEWNQEQKPQIIVRDVNIPHLQVFDWRNSSSLSDRLLELSIDNNKIILLYDEDLGNDLISIKDMNKISYQNWDQVADSKTTALVLVHMPPSLSVMREILKKYAKIERIYCIYGHNDNKLFSKALDRNLFKQIFATLKQNELLKNRFKAEHYFNNLGISSEIFQFVLDVFSELGFIIVKGEQIHFNPNPERKELTQSDLYRSYLEFEEVKQLFLYSTSEQLGKWFVNLEDQ
ncbi:MAG: single-stranded-DNA-specific exonuclease RecJ [Tepidibacillus sp.]